MWDIQYTIYCLYYLYIACIILMSVGCLAFPLGPRAYAAIYIEYIYR